MVFTIERLEMNFMTGEITDSIIERYAPSVLPMDRVDLTGRRFLVMATMTRKDHKGEPYFVKGDILSVDYIHRSGGIVVRKRTGELIPGMWPMDKWVQMLEIPSPPKAAKQAGAASA